MKTKFKPSIVVILVLVLLAFWFVAKKSGFESPSPSPAPQPEPVPEPVPEALSVPQPPQAAILGQVGKKGGACGYTQYKKPTNTGTFGKCWNNQGTCTITMQAANDNIKNGKTTSTDLTGVCQ
jgi:hypothetical protein